MKQVYGNTALNVLWTAGDVRVIRVGDTIGYATKDTLRTTWIPAQKEQEDGGSSHGSSGGGGGEWTSTAM